MAQSKEEHRIKNREAMRRKRAALREAAANGDKDAQETIKNYNARQNSLMNNKRKELIAKAKAGDKDAQEKLKAQRAKNALSLVYSYIKNKASLDELDELESLAKNRLSYLEK